jgi:CPA2 family monovalent cation:H+ antiporter-2
MIFLVPVLAGDAEQSGGEIASRVGLGLLIVAGAFLIARTVMPRILEWIVGTRTREVFVLGALAICLAMALITSHLGFSLALGAFLAGLIISESQYSHQVIAEVLPLRDVFNSLFFIAVGMLLDFAEVGRNAALVIGLGLSVLVVKAAIVTAITGWLGYAARVALIVGVSLAQIGEFSLVLAGVGREMDLLPGPLFQVFLGAAILTMLVTPLLIGLAPRMADRAPPVRIPGPLRRARLGTVVQAEDDGPREKHVIVVGYGLNGSNLSRVLASTGIPFVVLELNGSAVREGARRGHPVVFGDATRAEILASHGLARARMLVVGIADQAATRRIVRNARALNPGIHILVRTLEVGQVDELRSLGADDVIPEEFETSVEIFSRVLEHYHVPRNVIRMQRRIIRDEGYGVFRTTPSGAQRSTERIAELLESTLTETYLVSAGSPADGATLQGLDLRRRSGGASVIAVVRDGKAETNPSPELELRKGDNLVLVGNHGALEKAGRLLRRAGEDED